MARTRCTRQLDALVWRRKTHAANERFAKFLEEHLQSLFTFLEVPGSDATNWRAEQAVRPAVVNRKVWGGNRTWPGASVQSILMSLLRTLGQRHHDALRWLARALCATAPLALPTAGR